MAKTKEKPITKKELYSIAVRTRQELRLGRAELRNDMAGISNKRDLADNAMTLARDARTAFGEFLSRPEWDWYTTQTFKAEYVSPKQADRAWYAWLNSLRISARAKGLTPSIYGPAAPFYFRVTEYQDRGTLHFHSLIGNAGDIRRLSFKDFWELHGFARVEAYEPARGAAGYLAKYLNKTDGDIRFSHNLTPLLHSVTMEDNNGKT